MQDPAGPLVFIHVPRTGGTTVWQVFRSAWPGKVRRIGSGNERRTERQLNELLEHPTSPLALIGGHVRLSAVPAHVPKERMITFIRRPRERVISSWFSQIRTRKRNGIPVSEDRDALLEHAERTQFLALMLLTAIPRRKLAEWNEASDVGARARRLAAMIDGRFAFIGFLEHFDTSLCVLSAQMGWRSVPCYEEYNRGDNKSPLADETRAELDRLVRLEELVYQALLERRIRAWTRACRFLGLRVMIYRVRCRVRCWLKGARRAISARAS